MIGIEFQNGTFFKAHRRSKNETLSKITVNTCDGETFDLMSKYVIQYIFDKFLTPRLTFYISAYDHF
jgi:hypothetical protein